MNELMDGVSWLGVGSGFVVSFLLGWLWYGPLFGKQWAAGCGVELGHGKDMPAMAMATQALGTFCLSWVIGITATTDSLMTSVLILVTIMLLIVSNGKYVKKSNTAVGIEAAFIFAMGVVMVIFQGIF
ncbi:MAG: hypothetical protein ACI80V_002499 [Rhodothermales bacterium]|jgi:hypothetical protein